MRINTPTKNQIRIYEKYKDNISAAPLNETLKCMLEDYILGGKDNTIEEIADLTLYEEYVTPCKK